MVATTTEQEVLLVKVVVVIIKITHGHHALAVVGVYLGVDAIAGDAADMCVVHLADMVTHELHHLVLDGITLSVLCDLFHIGAVLAELLIVFFVGRAPALLIFCQQPVHHRVGIAADWRGEVSVILKSQSEVSDVVHTVLCLHHRTQSHTLHELLLALALTLVHELVDTLGHGTTCAVGLDLISELYDELSERLHLLRIRVVVDTIREYLGLLALGHTAHTLGYRAVGKEHELLDELVGILRPLEVATGRMAFLVDVEMEFLGVELHRAVLESLFTQFLGQSVKGTELPSVLILIACRTRVRSRLSLSVHDSVVLQHLLCLLISIATVGADDRVDDT